MSIAASGEDWCWWDEERGFAVFEDWRDGNRQGEVRPSEEQCWKGELPLFDHNGAAKIDGPLFVDGDHYDNGEYSGALLQRSMQEGDAVNATTT